MRLTHLLVGAALLAAVPASAQRVDGRLIERSTARPVPEATVALLTPAGRIVANTRSDTAGAFTIAVPRAGAYHLRAQRLGFQTVTSGGFEVSPGEELQVDFTMSTGPVQLEPLTITSRAEPPRVAHLETAGFYSRERLSPGTFLRRDAIRKGRNMSMSDVLSRLPGARRGTVRGRSVITIGRSANGRACPPSVFIDGQPLMMTDFIDDLVHLESVEAVEVYRGPSETPARFNSMERGCGVVVVWTKFQN